MGVVYIYNHFYVWPPPDSTGFQWESLGSSDGLNSLTRHHASPQNAACVVSGKAARPSQGHRFMEVAGGVARALGRIG